MSRGRTGTTGTTLRAIGALVFVCTIVTVLASSLAQAQTRELSVSIDGYSSRDWPRAQTIMTVLDADGKPVEGLTQENVSAQINGEEIAVMSVSRGVDSNLPSFVVLALDASAVAQGALLEEEKTAAHEFVDSLAPQDSIAILAYSDTPNLVQPFTQDRAAAHGAIDTLSAAGGTGLYKAATQSVLLGAASVQTGRRAVVLVSSAADGTQDSPAQSLVAAKGLGVPVFIAGVGPATDASYLQQLTDAAGGRFLETATTNGLSGLLGDISELLRNQYVVAFDASNLDVDTTNLVDLRVDVTAGSSTGSVSRIVCPGSVCAVFKDIEAGVAFSEQQQVVAEVVSSEQIQSVSLLVDGEPVETLQVAPYEFTVDPVVYASGDHTLALSVVTSSGTQQLGDVDITFNLPTSEGGGSSSMLPIVALVLVLVLVLAVVLFVITRRRKRGRGAPAPQGPAPEPSEPISVFIAKQRARSVMKGEESRPAPTAAEPTLGYLKMTDGPLSGQTFAVGAKPISIGSGHRCEIQLPLELDGYEVPSEYARVWIRGDQLMVHEIRRLTAMGVVGGRWEFLGERETFAIGPCVFRFDLDEEKSPEPVGPVPNVLRDSPQTAPSAELPAAPIGPVPEPAPSTSSGPFTPEPSPFTPESEAAPNSAPVPIAPPQTNDSSESDGPPDIFRDPPKAAPDEDSSLEQAAG